MQASLDLCETSHKSFLSHYIVSLVLANFGAEIVEFYEDITRGGVISKDLLPLHFISQLCFLIV